MSKLARVKFSRNRLKIDHLDGLRASVLYLIRNTFQESLLNVFEDLAH